MKDREKEIKHEMYLINLEIKALKKRLVQLNNELKEYHGEKNIVRKKKR